MTATSFFRGHPLIWVEDKWVYEDDHADMPAQGGETRPCKKCGLVFPLGGVDPCLGMLPGVDKACCGHGVRLASYVRFENGTVLKDFIVDKSPNARGAGCK